MLLSTKAFDNRGIRWLLVIVLVPEKGSSLGGENTRNPAVLIGDTPNSHTNALLDVNARLGNALVRIGLNGELLGSSRSVHPDVNLRVSNVDALVSGGAESGSQSLLVWSWAWSGGSCLAGKMRLVADAVDLDAVGLDKLHDTLSTESLVAVELEVVIIVWIRQYVVRMSEKKNSQKSFALLSYFFASLNAMGRYASPIVLNQTVSR